MRSLARKGVSTPKRHAKEAHGLWIPVVFGWMTHVYPNAKSPIDVWAGMDMHMDANTDDEEMTKQVSSSSLR
jgi:hypothetical protein